MATVETLAAQGALHSYDPILGPNQLVCRRIFLTPSLAKWIEDHLDYAAHDWNPSVLPGEQLDQIFTDFIIGNSMMALQDLKKLEPFSNHVWAMRTNDVRVFGIFHRKGTFIAAGCDLKKNLKLRRNYQPHIQSCLTAINGLALDNPTIMRELDLNDLL